MTQKYRVRSKRLLFLSIHFYSLFSFIWFHASFRSLHYALFLLQQQLLTASEAHSHTDNTEREGKRERDRQQQTVIAIELRLREGTACLNTFKLCRSWMAEREVNNAQCAMLGGGGWEDRRCSYVTAVTTMLTRSESKGAKPASRVFSLNLFSFWPSLWMPHVNETLCVFPFSKCSQGLPGTLKFNFLFNISASSYERKRGKSIPKNIASNTQRQSNIVWADALFVRSFFHRVCGRLQFLCANFCSLTQAWWSSSRSKDQK